MILGIKNKKQRGEAVMDVLSNSKIEDRALGVLENIIDRHQTMARQFNSRDKEMSWDGYIWIYKDIYGNQDKKNYDDRVPVQIKGHIDRKKSYMNKKCITYSVDLADLQIYFADRGVLYFQIFMSEDGERKEVFYTSLFPTKLKYYLERAEKKKRKKSINIQFTKLVQKPDNLYVVVKQFSYESKKQGFGHEQLVQNAIKEVDFDKVTEMSASVIGATNEYEFLKRLGSGDVSFYAKISGTPFSVPLEWIEQPVCCIVKEVKNEIWVGGRKYFDSYKVKISSEEELVVILSENIKVDTKNSKFYFKPKTCIAELCHDAEFLLAVIENKEISIGRNLFNCGNLSIEENLFRNLGFFVELDQILKDIDVEYTKRIDETSRETMQKFENLVSLRLGKKNHLFTENAHSYNVYIDGKYIPLIIFKNENGGKNEIFNAIYSNKYRLYVEGKNGENYQVPSFSNIEGNVMKNLYKYDIKHFQDQIENAEINKDTEEAMNLSALNLIHVYDKCEEKDLCLLEMAQKIYIKLSEMFGEKNIYIINKLQIKERKNQLTGEDIESLAALQCNDDSERCGKYILLGEKSKAEKCLSRIPQEERERFEKYPIYTLYMQM